jgi:serine/threonine protein phosphatase 1
MRIYAIGDVHGHDGLLKALTSLVEKDDASRAPANRRVMIFVGDYIDRGPDSRGVVDFLLNGLPKHFEAFFLRGNHEDYLLRYLSGPSFDQGWFANGGVETLKSYGVDIAGGGFDTWFTEETRDRFAAVLPESHVRFYRETLISVRFGDYFFAHAGIRPGVPLELQKPQDLLWIRQEFLRHTGDFGAVIVHGHTPVHAPEDLRNRICIDTYAFQTGHLTAVGLEANRRWFLSA